MKTKYQGEDVIELVTEILMADIYNEKDHKKMAILQDIVDSAKVSIAKRHLKTLEAQYRKEGKMIANKKEATKVIVKELNFSSDDLIGAVAKCYGIKL